MTDPNLPEPDDYCMGCKRLECTCALRDEVESDLLQDLYDNANTMEEERLVLRLAKRRGVTIKECC